MIKILPSSVFLFVDLTGGTAYKLLACLTSFQFSLNNAEIDAGTMCGPDKLPGDQSFDMSAEGQLIQFAVTQTTHEGHFEMLNAAKNKTLISFKIAPALPTTGQVVTTGQTYIGTYDNTYDKDNPATFSVTFSIKGTPLFVKTV